MPIEQDQPQQQRKTPQITWAVLACTAMLTAFAARSWLAVGTKPPTTDEPLHATGAFLHVFCRDFRVNPEDPPLWNYWAMLASRRGDLKFDFGDPMWASCLKTMFAQAT